MSRPRNRKCSPRIDPVHAEAALGLAAWVLAFAALVASAGTTWSGVRSGWTGGVVTLAVASAAIVLAAASFRPGLRVAAAVEVWRTERRARGSEAAEAALTHYARHDPEVMFAFPDVDDSRGDERALTFARDESVRRVHVHVGRLTRGRPGRTVRGVWRWAIAWVWLTASVTVGQSARFADGTPASPGTTAVFTIAGALVLGLVAWPALRHVRGSAATDGDRTMAVLAASLRQRYPEGEAALQATRLWSPFLLAWTWLAMLVTASFAPIVLSGPSPTTVTAPGIAVVLFGAVTAWIRTSAARDLEGRWREGPGPAHLLALARGWARLVSSASTVASNGGGVLLLAALVVVPVPEVWNTGWPFVGIVVGTFLLAAALIATPPGPRPLPTESSPFVSCAGVARFATQERLAAITLLGVVVTTVGWLAVNVGLGVR